MDAVKDIALDQILITERERPIDEPHALMIGMSMKEHGQAQSILVRPTPAAARPYTLVIGGHRTRGAGLVGLETITAAVRKMDAVDAKLLELVENLHRNDLNVLDRARFVDRYQATYESKYGRVKANGDRSAKFALCSDGEDVPEFGEYLAERLGKSRRSVFYLAKIARNIDPTLRSALAGTAIANNQQALLKLAKLSADDQLKIANTAKEGTDIKTALGWLKPAKAETDEQASLLKKLIAAWDDASDETRDVFIEHIGLAGGDALMRQIREEAA